MTFEKWMAKFDKLCVAKFGAPSICFPDWYFYSAWDNDMSVEEAFELWIEDQKENY